MEVVFIIDNWLFYQWYFISFDGFFENLVSRDWILFGLEWSIWNIIHIQSENTLKVDLCNIEIFCDIGI